MTKARFARALGAFIVVALIGAGCSTPAKKTSVLGVNLTKSPSPSATVHHTGPCVNSFSAKCGKLHWEPAPGHNAPLTVTVTAPASATAGQAIAITVNAVDPDAPISCNYPYYGEGAYVANAVTTRPRYGLWETPAKERGETTLTYHHTYAKAGTYHLQFTFVSGTSCVDPKADPYGSTGFGIATIIVSA